ncbi:hypothetical protein AVEN_150151-1 [Araneus ventricosus]|uniref:Uncharacterized protein n=1 Tax=Araneus ventricosus TaxID=182803 RepID=A0A4Y2KTX1_ARAVE|nr:hypothetical protein AVEN_150151-1 [Araneus ventricosus]
MNSDENEDDEDGNDHDAEINKPSYDEMLKFINLMAHQLIIGEKAQDITFQQADKSVQQIWPHLPMRKHQIFGMSACAASSYEKTPNIWNVSLCRRLAKRNTPSQILYLPHSRQLSPTPLLIHDSNRQERQLR